ncbi:MAG: histidinol-phosphate transaminase [Acidobacteriota bacterium]
MSAPTPVPDVRRLEPYTVCTAGRRGLLRLDFNEHTIGPSPHVLARVSAVTGEDLALYPDERAARAAVTRHFAFGDDVDFVLTSGADEGIRLVCDGFVQAGERVLLLEPGYAMYRFYATLAGAELLPVTVEDDLSFPARGVRTTLAAGARLVIIGDPHNPTGAAVPEGFVEETAGDRPETLVLVDEAYAEFAGRTALPLLARQPNVLVARTFSKAFGLAGLRIGLLAGHRDTIAWLSRMRSPYAVNSLAVIAVEAALEDPDWAESYATEVRESRSRLRDGLGRLGVPSYPSEANFVIARFGQAAPQIRQQLQARGVLVRDRSEHPLLEGTLRIGIGTREDTERCLEELARVLDAVGYPERTLA